jgi:hypothetical protein
VGDAVTDIVHRMTRDGVRRLEQLEVLLLMVRRPADAWTALGLAESSMLSTEITASALEKLNRLGFVEQVAGEPPRYRFGARVSVDELQRLKRVYERDRQRVVNEFFGCNLDVLRNFADAFKLRGDS